mmetsp:Transcript_42548/g.132752  ORF Transcript_42548/g.132752 Transcript_42548/m.132752 type:complete len:803 (+) Transcript_42548:1-2409(+)
MQEKVSALRDCFAVHPGHSGNPQDDCPPSRGWVPPGLDEVDGQPLVESRSPSSSSRPVTPTNTMSQVVLPPPTASPALSTCSIASMAKVQMEGGHERPGSAAVGSAAPQQQSRAHAARRGSTSPQPPTAAQRGGPGAPASTGSIGGVAPRRGPQTPIRGVRDGRSVATSVVCQNLSPTAEQMGSGAPGGSWVARGRRSSAQDGDEALHVQSLSFQGSVSPMHPVHATTRGTSAIIPSGSPKGQYSMHMVQAQRAMSPVQAHRATSPIQVGSSAAVVPAAKTSPRPNYYPMSRSATPQGVVPPGSHTPRTGVVAAKAMGQRSQSPVRRRQPAPGANSPGYPHGSAAVPMRQGSVDSRRLNSAPHGSATPTVGQSPWQQMPHSPMRNSVARGNASIQATPTAPPPAVLPPPASEPVLERVPSRSLSQMDLSGSGVPPPPTSQPNLGTVPPPTSGPSTPLGAVPALPSGASVNVAGPLITGKSFAATNSPQAGMSSVAASMAFGMPGQPPGAIPAAAKAPGPLPAASAPLAGSPQHGAAAPGTRTLHARSPSRTRNVNPSVVSHNMYSSPFAVRKDPVVNMFSPQVPAPPPVFAMQRCSTSMTSSNNSFYFAPQHGAVAGPSPNPVPASHYVADGADPIDLMLSVGLSSLDRCTSSKLMLRRLGMGRYEIDGRRVSLKWTDQGGQPGLSVCEDEVTDKGSEMPLLAYLSQAANVAASLSGGRADMPKISRVPKEQRLTFAEEATESTSTLDVERVGNERCESMRIACEQARLREQAAEAYESGKYAQYPQRSLPPPPGLPMPYLN